MVKYSDYINRNRNVLCRYDIKNQYHNAMNQYHDYEHTFNVSMYHLTVSKYPALPYINDLPKCEVH